jgi:hypothetical protein
VAQQFKLTIKRGQKAPDVVRSAGTVIAGSDAIELNVDNTNMSKLDLKIMLRELEKQILGKGFPQ